MNTIFLKNRHHTAECCELESPLQGAVEVDESYFGAHRVRGADGKTVVFGLLKRQGKFTMRYVPYCAKPTQQAIIRGHVDAGAVIHSDGWRGYDGLVDIGFDKHFRVNHGENKFANGEDILMVLSLSGVMLNDAWQSLTARLNTRFICT